MLGYKRAVYFQAIANRAEDKKSFGFEFGCSNSDGMVLMLRPHLSQALGNRIIAVCVWLEQRYRSEALCLDAVAVDN